MSRPFLLACVQLQSNNDLSRNLERCRFWIRDAAERGAEFVLLPEDFAFLAESEQEKKGLSVSDLARITDMVREEAIRHSVLILAGGYPTCVEGDERLTNTSTLISKTGEVLADYRKIHLFDADPPGAKPLRESEHIIAGDKIVVADTPLARVGLSICYDLRFPELYRALSMAGADLLTIPAAFTLTTGKDHWEVLLRARAIETQCYVAAPAQWGFHNANRHSFGRAMICDPWGTPLAVAPEGEGIAVAEFNPERLSQVRSIVPCRQHIRRDLFSVPQEGTDV